MKSAVISEHVANTTSNSCRVDIALTSIYDIEIKSWTDWHTNVFAEVGQGRHHIGRVNMQLGWSIVGDEVC